MAAQEQNKLVNISKFIGYNFECYINPAYITKICKSKFDDEYCIEISGGSIIHLLAVHTKEHLNEFLDHIYNR